MRTLAGLLGPIARRAARWAKDHLDDIREADPAVPDKITSDRACDNWRGLLAIADLSGPDWERAARAAALELTGVEAEDTGTGVLLLADLRAVFARTPASNIPTRDVIAALTDLDDRPWPTFSHGKTITAAQLAELLRPFKIKPKTIRSGETTYKGYLKEDFADAWTRYLPSSPGDTPS
jgi:putative DNA primase/helicase